MLVRTNRYFEITYEAAKSSNGVSRILSSGFVLGIDYWLVFVGKCKVKTSRPLLPTTVSP